MRAGKPEVGPRPYLAMPVSLMARLRMGDLSGLYFKAVFCGFISRLYFMAVFCGYRDGTRPRHWAASLGRVSKARVWLLPLPLGCGDASARLTRDRLSQGTGGLSSQTHHSGHGRRAWTGGGRGAGAQAHLARIRRRQRGPQASEGGGDREALRRVSVAASRVVG